MRNIFKLLVVLVVAIVFTACGNNDGCPEGYSRINDVNKVGYYEAHHKLGNGTQVFLITTPRGPEYVVGRENLQWSLDVYRENGTYGKDYKSL